MKDIVDLFLNIQFENNKKGKYQVYLDVDENWNGVYVGFAGRKNPHRPTCHKKDLLNSVRKSNKKRLCFSREGLSKTNAHTLEAFLIKYGSEKYGLTKRGCYEYKNKKLINKRRELKWEKYIEKTLAIDGNNNSNIIKRKSNNN